MRDKAGAAVVSAVFAAAALILTISLIAEIAAVPTSDPGIHSSTWTPATAITAAFFGHSAFHGDFAPLSILFGWFAILLASVAMGALWTAFLVYCLGWSPHPLASAILGAACGLATQILLLNLLCNWLQPENGIYTSLPTWGWWVGTGVWGVTLGLSLARKGKKLTPAHSVEGTSAGTPATGPGMTPTNTRSQFDDIWNVYWPIALAVFLIILALVIFLGFRYRARSRSSQIPRGRDENEALEAGYALGLASIAAFLAFLTFSHMPGNADEGATAKPVEVKVTGARWNWRFEYPEFGIVEQGTQSHVPVLRVPVDTEVDFEGRSIDVIHSFWIPSQRFKRDVFPTFPNRWEMVFGKVATEPGGGSCAEFCGLEHWDMVFNVLVMPRQAFARWAGGGAGEGATGEGGPGGAASANGAPGGAASAEGPPAGGAA